MNISFAGERPWECLACGATTLRLLWLAVDIVERPDLRGVLSAESWLRTPCQECGRAIRRTEPLLVTRLAKVAPVVLAVSDDLVDSKEPPEEFVPIIDRARVAIGDLLGDIPGPMLLVPFEALVVGAGRDVDRDIDRGWEQQSFVAEGVAEGASSYSREQYSVLLEKIRNTSAHRRLHLAINRLIVVTSREELHRLVEEFPELADPSAVAELTNALAATSNDEARHVASSRLALITAICEGDLEGGWAAYEVALLRFMEDFVNPRLDRLANELRRLGQAGEHWGVVEIGREIMAIARQGGMVELEAGMCMEVAAALQRTQGEGRAQRIDEAIDLMEHVLRILDANPELDSLEARAEPLANLGAAYGSRLLGDPVANLHRALAFGLEVLDLLSMEKHGDLLAMTHTNVGLALLELLTFQEWQDTDSRDESVRDAIGHFESALQWRSIERNPLDWAFTQINLGLALARRARGDRSTSLSNAIRHFEFAAEGFRAAGAMEQWAQAMHDIASAKRDMAHTDKARADQARALLAEAEAAARSSLEVTSQQEASIDASRTFLLLGRIREELDDRLGAIQACSLAMNAVRPEDAPRACREAAVALGTLAAQEKNWLLAANAWETAAVAATAAFESRATSEGRFAELREDLNVFRWAAYSLGRVNRLERAVEILELGRARELAVRMQRDAADLTNLDQLDPSLKATFLELRSRMEALDRDSRAGIPFIHAEAGVVAERFHATVESIRALPGFGAFLYRPSFADIVATARPGWPIAYMVTAPEGSLALIVWADETPAHNRVESVDVPSLTSSEVVEMLLDIDLKSKTFGGSGGYVAAQAGESASLNRVLDDLGSSVGDQLMKPLADALAAGSASGVCLVPVMLMGLLPLHTLQWPAHGNRCLLDDFDVAFAPSATARALCEERAGLQAREPRRLVVVGNPLPHSQPLPGAEREAEMVAATFHSNDAKVLVGEAATKEAVMRALPGATHVHFACHASSDWRDAPMTAGLSFASEEILTSAEIANLGGVAARLVVASACQTGVIQGYEAADEALGLATAFIAAGASGVVATLWPVDDYATALLMSRFYELLSADRDLTLAEPATALRAAQLWLRSLRTVDEEEYLQKHPMLRSHREAHERRSATRLKRLGSSRPYAAPDLWGPFVFVGG